jgi:CAAX prenyl protease-like protein
MQAFIRRLTASPTAVRVAPFVAFVALTACQEFSGALGRYWFYVVKTVIVGGLLWWLRSFIPEMRWRFSAAAVWTGLGVFVLWIGLDPALGWVGLRYPKLQPGAAPWNPQAQFGDQALLAGMLVAVRAIGSSVVVPAVEEVFYRSFLYRYLGRSQFLSLPLSQFSLGRFVACATVFGLSHREWLAGILCGLAYQALVVRKNRLGDAVTAHSVTNFLLACWVVGNGAWHLW